MIRTEKLVKTYGEGELALTVLKSLDLEIQSGEFVAIVGPSGAGKSTLLYQISLLDEPTSGKIFLDDVETGPLSLQRKTLIRLNEFGYVFQDYALLPELTAVENVALPLMMQGLPDKDALRQAKETLERIGLTGKDQNLPSQLSGGQQQRVSIARAIAHSPRVLFADEPTANLDSSNSRLVMESFMELHDAGQTIIMVTHEEEYARLARRVITLKDGAIVEDKKR
jgi:putative ABC transport system ATP-binding protein